MSLVVAAAVALTPVMPASASERELLRASALESSILAQINTVRAKHGKAPLKLSPALSAAARSHSQAMASKGFFSHDSANGSSFSTRVRKWYGPKGYRSWAAGENLLWRSPDIDAAAAVQMWMESPGHRANLLRAGWREVGLGAIHAYAAPGAFGGLEVTVVTADFGTRT
jgi:uncharacterized protein YkwD